MVESCSLKGPLVIKDSVSFSKQRDKNEKIKCLTRAVTPPLRASKPIKATAKNLTMVEVEEEQEKLLIIPDSASLRPTNYSRSLKPQVPAGLA